jgi:hypothetical protein
MRTSQATYEVDGHDVSILVNWDRVVKIGERGNFFPAGRCELGLLVDLRMFGTYTVDEKTNEVVTGKLGWHPEKLPKGIAQGILDSAESSEPQGIALLKGEGK